ncbi:acid protease [Trichodelitschia bisporula]|uniref:Acid protease n=1 Tax=Trichodelitschia bisporula TaxID=703511 RepID=A0A6G1HTL6_9PEZI|nr:acid protease [Trichodelitschia bisporula]
MRPFWLAPLVSLVLAAPQAPPPLRLSLHRRSAHVKRDNTFNVLESTTPSEANSAGIAQDGNDMTYFAVVNIGTSKKSFYLLLDTAATNTWAMGSACTSQACGVHNTLDSTSLKTTKDPFSITYGTGSVSGVQASDTMRLGPGLSVPMTFGLANKVSDDFLSFAIDGILAMSYGPAQSARTIPAANIVETLVAQKSIPKKLFGLAIARAGDGPNDGEVLFGDVDKSRFDGDLKYVPVVANDRGFWEIAAGGIGVDSKAASLSGARTAIIDSGTSYIFMSASDSAAIHALILGAKAIDDSYYQLPCSTSKPLWIQFGDTKWNILAKDFVGDPLEKGSPDCRSRLVTGTPFGDSKWLVGDVFLKNVYAAFDYDGGRVGFAALKDTATGMSSPIPASDPASPPAPTSMVLPETAKASVADSGPVTPNAVVHAQQTGSSATTLTSGPGTSASAKADASSHATNSWTAHEQSNTATASTATASTNASGEATAAAASGGGKVAPGWWGAAAVLGVTLWGLI